MQQLLDDYYRWLRSQSDLREVGEWIEITTPYLDRHNDHLQIYAQRRDEGYVLTDGGYILDDLAHSGCSMDTERRQALLTTTLNGFHVHQRDNALETMATYEDFAIRKHSLIQAMLAVNDMFYLAVPMIARLFYDDVMDWLDLCEIRYTTRLKITGKSGFDSVFDFVIPKSREYPERIVHLINRPSPETVKNVVFAWVDTKDIRLIEARAYAMLNDTEQPIPPSTIDALQHYDVRPVRWSHREEIRDELAA
jgi:hypothetical protein